MEYCLKQDKLVGTSDVRASIYLEYGLACHHFDYAKKGKELFGDAMKASGVCVEVTGSEGKRTKFQRKATAQMIVRATSSNVPTQKEQTPPQENADPASTTSDPTIQVKSQMIEHTEDSILYERVQYEDSKDNETSELSVLDQSILLALCLDVKNTNPADGLTGEEMGAYLARVLQHHDDWMVYSTALLERAWLEFEGNHTKERAILQMQALADQHTNRLTLTQSTRQSVEESSPVQDRLRHVHGIVYPPRWHMLGDIANRYASLGIVTSAAEIFVEIESWDEVVECYRRAGKEKRAEEIVRERLQIQETPRMWMVLGDLTEDPSHYEKAIELSRGRFAQAYVNLGKYHFDRGDLSTAKDAYKKSLRLRPLVSSVWFRVGTISMQLGDWGSALQAFSEVVQQQPDEAEAWANVAAVHMHNKHPEKAYPALTESLKQNRNNWRIWVSKLYTCLDLEKYDEAIQACNMLMDLKANRSASGVPDLEEKCIKAIVGGIVEMYQRAKTDKDYAGLEVQRRSLNRAHALLERLRAASNEPWVFETLAYFHENVGQDQEVLNNLMQEYRSLLSVKGWEKDDAQVRKMCQVVSQIVHYQRGNKEQLTKSKFLSSSVLKKVQQARADMGSVPSELAELEQLVDEITKEIRATS
jgi:tetratricopeptide (TPR) repeat protein